MNDKLEQIERLRERAKVTYDEAKHAYEAAGGDLLEALILLEKQGKVKPPRATVSTAVNSPRWSSMKKEAVQGREFRQLAEAFLAVFVGLFHRCNNTTVEMIQNDETKVKIPSPS